jgi:hypothetical protein
MSKAAAEALTKLKTLVDKGRVIQIETMFGGYEVTIYRGFGEKDHHHIQGATLIEAIMKVKNDIYGDDLASTG